MSKLVYGVEVWQYLNGDTEFVHHWTDRVFLTEQSASSYADSQDKLFVCPISGEKWEQGWEVVMLVLEDE